MSGYARFHRSLIGHPAFRNDAEAMAFAYMVLRASWRPVRVRYKGKALNLSRGQLAMSVRDLAEAMDRDKGWVERLLKRLKSETMVETVSETGVMVITICNYEKYQAANDGSDTPRETPDETRARQTQDTEQGREEGKKEEETLPSGSVARARKADPFPRPDWADPAVWADFLTNRKKKRLSNTPTAHKAFLADIARHSDPHWPPGRLLEVATAKGHGAIYPSIKDCDDASRIGRISPRQSDLQPRRSGLVDAWREANAAVEAESPAGGSEDDPRAWLAFSPTGRC